MDKAGGGLTYRLRVVPPNVIESRLTATEHEVKNLRANTNYTVYVSAGSLGPYGSEVSIVTTTVGSESLHVGFDLFNNTRCVVKLLHL